MLLLLAVFVVLTKLNFGRSISYFGKYVATNLSAINLLTGILKKKNKQTKKNLLVV